MVLNVLVAAEDPRQRQDFLDLVNLVNPDASVTAADNVDDLVKKASQLYAGGCLDFTFAILGNCHDFPEDILRQLSQYGPIIYARAHERGKPIPPSDSLKNVKYVSSGSIFPGWVYSVAPYLTPIRSI